MPVGVKIHKKKKDEEEDAGGEASQDITKRDKVLVCVRVRPLNGKERKERQTFAWKLSSTRLVQQDMGSGGGRKPEKYDFDMVYNPDTTNEDIFNELGFASVKSAMNGYHGVVFAYGQTSSGKTYTIHGSEEDPGMIPRSIEAMFEWIENTPSRDFVMRVAYIEIYNEVVNDLITPGNANLKVREDQATGVFVENLSETACMSAEQVFALIAAGESHRHIGRTDYNAVSSRSHTIFRIMVESQTCDDEDADRSVLQAVLNLVDLAGSENTAKVGSGGAVRVKETGHINKSLLALASVIRKLSENKKGMHIPFRDSKLTRILQPCLNGESLISIICALSPSSGNMEESISTLKFANRAKHIANTAKQNKTISKDTIIAKYKSEIDQLKAALEAAQSGGGLLAASNQDPSTVSLSALEDLQEQQEEEKGQLNAKIEHLTRIILRSSNEGVGDQWAAKDSKGRARSTIGPAVVQSTPVRKPSYFAMLGGGTKPAEGAAIKRSRTKSDWGRKQSVGLNAMTGNVEADGLLCLPAHVTDHFVKQQAQEEIARISKKATGAEAQVALLQQKLLEQQGQIKDVEEENASLLEELENMRQELAARDNEFFDLEEKLYQADEQLLDYEQELELLRKDSEEGKIAAAAKAAKREATKKEKGTNKTPPANITITVSCRELPFKSNRNPLVGFFVQKMDSGLFEYEGRTEWVQDSCNPIFTRKFTVRNIPEAHIRFSVYDVDNEQSIQAGDYIGSCTLNLADVCKKAESMGGGLFATAEENQFVPFELETEEELPSYLCLKIHPKSKSAKKNAKARAAKKHAVEKADTLSTENEALKAKVESLTARLGI